MREIQWEKIRQSQKINPTPHFKEELRATLYENAIHDHQIRFERVLTKIKAPQSHLEIQFSSPRNTHSSFSSRFFQIFHSFKQWIFLAGSGALAMMIIVPMFSIFTSSPLSASTKSYINTFSGAGEIIRLQEKNTLESQKEIFEKDNIFTYNNSSAEILFFEGTSLRLDKNTHITITNLSPEKGIFAKGKVKIELHEGRIWIQNFHSPSSFSALEIKTQNTNIFPIRANIDIEYRGGKEHIRVFENSALVNFEGLSLESELLLSEKKEVFFTPFDRKIITSTIAPTSSLWKIKNINRSNQHKREYLKQISNKMKEEFVIEELSSQIHTFIAQNPSPQEMEKMISKINTLMYISDNKEDNEKKEEESIITSNDNEVIEISEQKILLEIPSHKKEKEKEKEVITLSKNTPIYLPQISSVQKKTQKARKTLSTFSLEEKEEKENQKTPETQEQESSLKTAKQIIEEKRIEKFKKASQNFSDQINMLHLRDSRRNHAQNILNKIPDTPENLKLLEIMAQSAPTDVQRYIQAKKIKIEREQKN